MIAGIRALANRPAMQRAVGGGLAFMLCVTLLCALLPGVSRGYAVMVYLIVLPLTVPFYRRQHALFAVVCLVMALLLARRGEWEALGHALWQSSGLAALIVALVVLRSCASYSASLVSLAGSVAAMPERSRDLGLAFAAHYIGILLNVGLFGLFAPLIASAGASPDDRRRMSLSVLRGFAVTMMWAPTAAAQVVIASVVPGITWAGLTRATFPLAMAVILLGGIYRWTGGRGRTAPLPRPRAEQRIDRAALTEMAFLVGVMFTMILTLHAALGIPLLVSVTTATLSMVVLWTVVQARNEGRLARGLLTERIGICLDGGFARAVPEVMTLATAGFMGTAIALLIPEAWIAEVMVPLSERRMVLYPSVAVAITLLSAVGLNPLVAASLIGGTFAAIPPETLEPGLLAFSLAAGWGVAYGISPFTTGAVVLASTLGVRPSTIALRWNGGFTLMALGFVLSVICIAVAMTEPATPLTIAISTEGPSHE